VLRAGGATVRDLGDSCLLAGPGAPVLLAGHLDTVPAQGNRPGRRDGERVYGLGASDMKGAVAVMIELALAGAPFDCLLFGREELPMADSALTPAAWATSTRTGRSTAAPGTPRGPGTATTRSTGRRPRSPPSPSASRSRTSSTG
jgi:hypothetical protein